jgi:serine/threonine protein kinase
VAAPRATGIVLGVWRLVHLIGEGQWSQVFAAEPADREPSPWPAYAVKVLAPRHRDNPLAVICLEREAAVAREVRHPRLAPVLAAGVSRSPPHLVMPRLPGLSLDRPAARRRLSLTMCLCVARQMAEGLAALHERDWVHADVKPGNIVVSPTGQATLLDLGFARRAGELRGFVRRPLLGAPAYLAPEAFTSTTGVDARSDLYSLGATLFELLAGRPPFFGATAADLAQQHLTAAPPDLRRLAPQLPGEVARLVVELLAKQPIRRPHSARELVERLVALEILTFEERSVRR